jgi:hypothetical protein
MKEVRLKTVDTECSAANIDSSSLVQTINNIMNYKQLFSTFMTHLLCLLRRWANGKEATVNRALDGSMYPG